MAEARLAIADQSFRTVTRWEQTLDIMKALEIDYVDLCVLDTRSHLQFRDLFGDLAALAERVNGAVAKRGMTIASLDVTPGFTEIPGKPGAGYEEFSPNHPDPDERARAWKLFQTSIELAERTGAGVISIPAGINFESESHDASVARGIEEMARRHEYATSRGVIFSAEAHVGSVFESPQDCLDLVAAVPGLLVTVDPTNFAYLGYSDEEIAAVIPHAGHFHARGGRKGMAQTTWPNNTINYEYLISELLNSGYDKFVRLECVWRDYEDYLEDIDVVTEIVNLRDLCRGWGVL
jgi:sugar phosphate isomerase/epimerase